MKKMFRLSLLIIPFVLGGCTATSIDPINPYFNKYASEENSAIVLIGKYSKTPTDVRHVEIKKGTEKMALVSGAGYDPLNAMAFKIKVGESFFVTKVRFWDKKTGDTMRGYNGHYVDINNGYTLKIKKKGIYYYGTVIVKDEKVHIGKKAPPQIIKIAKRKYPEIFKDIKPVNFK